MPVNNQIQPDNKLSKDLEIEVPQVLGFGAGSQEKILGIMIKLTRNSTMILIPATIPNSRKNWNAGRQQRQKPDGNGQVGQEVASPILLTTTAMAFSLS